MEVKSQLTLERSVSIINLVNIVKTRESAGIAAVSRAWRAEGMPMPDELLWRITIHDPGARKRAGNMTSLNSFRYLIRSLKFRFSRTWCTKRIWETRLWQLSTKFIRNVVPLIHFSEWLTKMYKTLKKISEPRKYAFLQLRIKQLSLSACIDDNNTTIERNS